MSAWSLRLLSVAGPSLLCAGMACSVPASAQEPNAQAEPQPESKPLHLRVKPSGYERSRETLEQKIARRQRESDYQFRWICRGCLPGVRDPSTEPGRPKLDVSHDPGPPEEPRRAEAPPPETNGGTSTPGP